MIHPCKRSHWANHPEHKFLCLRCKIAIDTLDLREEDKSKHCPYMHKPPRRKRKTRTAPDCFLERNLDLGQGNLDWVDKMFQDIVQWIRQHKSGADIRQWSCNPLCYFHNRQFPSLNMNTQQRRRHT
jgi:hypothetical protein